MLDELAGLGAELDPGAARKAVEGMQAGLDPDVVAVSSSPAARPGAQGVPRLRAEYW